MNHSIFLAATLFLFCTIFPVFVIVYRGMREKEKTTAVYPITNHFYRATCCTYSVFLLAYSLGELRDRLLKENRTVTFFVKWLSYLFLVFLKVHLVILSLLAVQRFLLYFFPDYDKYIALKEKPTNRLLLFLYIVFFVKSIVAKVYFDYFKSYAGYIIDETHITNPFQLFLTYELLTLYGILFASSLLYIPVIISIKKQSHLVSVVKNKPHQFILYQTLLVVASKLGSTPFDHLESSDVISTPVLIQVSYLLCNQKNVEELRKSLSIRKVIKKLFMFMWKRIKREQNRVEPVAQLQIEEMRTTVV
ncbi:hypothetical protein CAEBREN_21442 [Caenorhabditis brenneri]|uniref:Serpentine Receptor, class Z n=1 Tax=Caenorhabditis brenneri TaxID=135651 RepID=G0N348_CAEBE|nr:hypothetical protein CAEBREN_21442 [Caenorhabditis brenneri]